MSDVKPLMSVREVADLTPWSVDTIKRAIRATDPSAFPPPLKAKKGAKGAYAITAADFHAWIDSLEDA